MSLRKSSDRMKDASRRDALKAFGAASAPGLFSCDREKRGKTREMTTAEIRTVRMPAVFLPHGGGPWPFMRRGAFGAENTYDKMSEYLRALPSVLLEEPKAVLVISAHWEEAVVSVQSSASPPLLYDYSGFPPETYQVTWPAPGAPKLASRVRTLLGAAGFESAEDTQRGYDHGTFVPLSLSYPEPKIPTLQLSLKKGLDPEEHLRMGMALSPLRNEGVFIVGSGMSYHNMGGFFGRVPSMNADSASFQEWLRSTITSEVEARNEGLVRWHQAPCARACHPREEHLLPLMVVAGTAVEGAGVVPYEDVLMGAHVLAAHFA
jgi:aromatic ring-opening dioxygenase catalytic subunit (LigB family)